MRTQVKSALLFGLFLSYLSWLKYLLLRDQSLFITEVEKGKEYFADDRMAFIGNRRGISRLLQSLKGELWQIDCHWEWSPSIPFPGDKYLPVPCTSLHFCSNASVIWENQKKQEAKSEKQQAAAQCFNFLVEMPSFGKHWMADDRSEV